MNQPKLCGCGWAITESLRVGCPGWWVQDARPYKRCSAVAASNKPKGIAVISLDFKYLGRTPWHVGNSTRQVGTSTAGQYFVGQLVGQCSVWVWRSCGARRV